MRGDRAMILLFHVNCNNERLDPNVEKLLDFIGMKLPYFIFLILDQLV
jgi:hypothetical protein